MLYSSRVIVDWIAIALDFYSIYRGRQKLLTLGHKNLKYIFGYNVKTIIGIDKIFKLQTRKYIILLISVQKIDYII